MDPQTQLFDLFLSGFLNFFLDFFLQILAAFLF
jgi:hypothetical protein